MFSGKLTISMAMFDSYVRLAEGNKGDAETRSDFSNLVKVAKRFASRRIAEVLKTFATLSQPHLKLSLLLLMAP